MATQGQVIENPRTGQTMTFLLTARDTQSQLLRIDCSSPPTAVKEPEHIHPYQENRFEILTGTLLFKIDGKERQAQAGDVISIPPGSPHFFWNAGTQAAHYLQEFRPALQIEDFFVLLFGLARAGKLNDRGMPGLLQLAVMVPGYWNEIRVTQPPPAFQRVFFGLLNPLSRSLGYSASI
jgi:quercetin dioxygenase-like cupin family protein